MIKFNDALAFKVFLDQKGFDTQNLVSEYSCEAFCNRNPDFYYQEDRLPKFIYDDEKNMTFEIIVTKHRISGSKVIESPEKTIVVSTSIPFEYSTIIAFEDMAWRSVHKDLSEWLKEPGCSTPSLKYRKV